MTGLSKTSKEILKLLNGQEISSINYESTVGIKGNKVISYGKVIDKINTNRKLNRLYKEYEYQEYGTNDFKKIMKMEGFDI